MLNFFMLILESHLLSVKVGLSRKECVCFGHSGGKENWLLEELGD